jgi:hypothetical protein
MVMRGKAATGLTASLKWVAQSHVREDGVKAKHVVSAVRRKGLLSGVRLDVRGTAIRVAVDEALAKLPPEASGIPTLRSITSKKTSEGGSLAGLTRRITYERTIRLGPAKTEEYEIVVQRIELYRDIMLQLSERSRVAVVAHELAHAWLNDNVGPEDSAMREEECDAQAEKWGFGDELKALADETD